nr:hypothetical protein Cry52Nrm1_p007 [Cryptomonas curvata]
MNNFYLFKTCFHVFHVFLKIKNFFSVSFSTIEYFKFVKFEFVYKFTQHFLNNKTATDVVHLMTTEKINNTNSFFLFFFKEFIKTPIYLKIFKLISKKKKGFVNIFLNTSLFFSKSMFAEKVKNLIIREIDPILYICFQSKNLLKKWLMLKEFDFTNIKYLCVFCIYIRIGPMKNSAKFSILLFKIILIIYISKSNLTNNEKFISITCCFFFYGLLNDSKLVKQWYYISLDIFCNNFFLILLDNFYGKILHYNGKHYYRKFIKNFIKQNFIKQNFIYININFFDCLIYITFNYQQNKAKNYIGITFLLNSNKKNFHTVLLYIFSKCIKNLINKFKKKFFIFCYNFKNEKIFKEKTLIQLFYKFFSNNLRKIQFNYKNKGFF